MQFIAPATRESDHVSTARADHVVVSLRFVSPAEELVSARHGVLPRRQSTGGLVLLADGTECRRGKRSHCIVATKLRLNESSGRHIILLNVFLDLSCLLRLRKLSCWNLLPALSALINIVASVSAYLLEDGLCHGAMMSRLRR